MAEIEVLLERRKEEGSLRFLRPASSRKDGRICFGGKAYIDFSSNDYLGFAAHPKLIAAAKKAIDQFGTSASASRLLSGDLDIYHKLEEKIARFKNKEAALFFNSGYQANVGIISALYDKSDCIFSDRLNHASITDGIILSGARFFRFQHNDSAHLESILKNQRRKFKNGLIVTETVFSMDGDKASLKELVSLKEKYNCRLLVDEAHSTGIFGKNGSGLVEEDGLQDEVDFIMGTFSKALGSFGAYLAASKKTIDYLINTCRSFIYSTALPAAIAAVNIAAIDLVKEEPERRIALLKQADFFRNSLKAEGFKIQGSTQIIPLIIGDNFSAKDYAEKLQRNGWWVLPIRPPTVPIGQARLRFSLSAGHNEEILGRLLDDIGKLGI